MTLVDSSVWIDHLRRRNPRLTALLEQGEVTCHPFVVGEIAMGNLAHRQEILSLLAELPSAPVVPHDDALECVERRQLFSRGLGWVDVHLLASALIERLPLWTLDRRLDQIARELGISAT